jgi:hypothetical protein
MKLAFILIFALLTSSVNAAGVLNAGLWKFDMKIKSEGQTVNATKEFKKALEELPEEEQEEVQGALKESVGIDEDGRIEVCHSEESLKRDESMMVNEDNVCFSKVITRNNKRIVTDFSCLNGTNGRDTWFIHNNRSYTGVTKVIAPDGEEAEFIYRAKYVSPLCETFDDVVI